jgi:hypothetical protein
MSDESPIRSDDPTGGQASGQAPVQADWDESDEVPFEVRRWRSSTVRVFAAMDTMDQIAERVMAVVGQGRVMNTTWAYVHQDGLEDLRHLRYATGLHMGGHAAYPQGHHAWRSEDQAGFAVYLTHKSGSLGSMDGFGAGVMAYRAATEEQVRARFNQARAPEATTHDRRSDITYLEITGRPGEPHRDDRIEVMDWNEHGVLRHTIITFVEPEYCDSGRVVEKNLVVLGHLVDPEARPYSARDTEAEVFLRLPSGSTVEEAEAEQRTIQAREDVEFAWVAEESVTRERRSIR